jgi:hypothetical protein
MQLTMPILADELSDYSIDSTLTPGAAALSGIRLGPWKNDEQYVYLSQDGADVICCNGRDCIRVRRAMVSQVFNTISSLTERLQNWEDTLNGILYSGGTLNELLACSTSILNNPIFIVDEREIVFAMTDHPAGTVDSEWDYMLKHGRMPYHRVSAIYRDSDFKKARRSSESENEPFYFQPPGMTHRGINYRIPDPSADSFLGTIVVVESQTPFTEGLLHLSRTLIKAVVKWTQIHKNDHNMKNISHLFTDLLDGTRVDDDEIAMTKALNNLDDENFILAVIPPDGPNHPYYVAPVLEGEITRSRCFEYGGSLLMLCALPADTRPFNDGLLSIAEELQIRMGISYPFANWRAMKSAYRQANIALGFSQDRLSRLNSESAMNYLVSELSLTLHGIDILHPALKRLDEYDKQHGTQYFSTLYTYLKHERNLVKTAATLFIHRNSLVYRIARIEELITADLEDSSVRHYMLLSYLCHEAARRKA